MMCSRGLHNIIFRLYELKVFLQIVDVVSNIGVHLNSRITIILYIHLLAGIGSIISEVVSSIGNDFIYVINI